MKVCRKCELFGRDSLKPLSAFPLSKGKRKSPCNECRRGSAVARRPKSIDEIMPQRTTPKDFFHKKGKLARTKIYKEFQEDYKEVEEQYWRLTAIKK